jgi:hypothetical protein
MDRAEPRQSLDGAEAPQSPVARHSEEPAVDHDGQPALPPPQALALEQPERPRGRHEATRRRSLGGPAGVAIAVAVSVGLAGVLATWLISSAKERPTRPLPATRRPPPPMAAPPRGHLGRGRSAISSSTGASSRA